ncbi:hypothetical protein [Nonomuraea sp. NPDC023979]|uniref:hypothetical protein n=1 Tax=Nonomuraea sp. NPDC023979 TaxID=3154796 RepID=UPI0033E0F68A
MPERPSPAGPIFGPDTVVVEVDGPTGGVHVRPDAGNPALRAAGLPARYYVQPARMALARRQASPDLDFSASVLVKGAPGTPEYVGGSCTFGVALALPPPALEIVTRKLAHHDHPDPAPRIAELFERGAKEPAPSLTPVQVTRSVLSCVIEGEPPLVMTAQHGATGSVEAQGHNTFLVSFTPAAAEAVVRNLRDGAAPPFTIRNRLTEQFTTGPAVLTARVDVDADKLYDLLRDAAGPGGALPEDVALDAVHTAALARGAVTTRITDAGHGSLDARTTRWLGETDEIKAAVLGLVRQELFDLGGGPGTATLKRDHPRTGTALSQVVTLHGPVSAARTVEGDLQELASAARTDLGKYLVVVDAGAF